LRDLTRDLSEIIAKTNKGEGTFGKLVNDDQLYKAAVSITRNADNNMNILTERLSDITDIIVNTGKSIGSIIANVDTAVTDVRHLVDRVEKGEGVLGTLITDQKVADSIRSMIFNLSKTSEDARMATSSFAENMEALKHNWLFKSYFEQRGYWNKAEFQIEIDKRLQELKNQNDLLDKRIKELLELEKKLEKK